MTAREISFALFAVLIAFAVGAWERIAYEWDTVLPAWKTTWIVVAILALNALAIWATAPFCKYLM